MSSLAAGSTTQKPLYKFWAVLGGFFVLLQTYIYGRWFLQGSFHGADPGSDPLPDDVRIGLVIFQIFCLGLGVIGLILFTSTLIKQKRMTPLLLMMVGWLFTWWQDPWLNAYQPQFFYNAYLFNLGSWANFIPGWASPNGDKLPEPLLTNLAAYFFIMPMAAWLGAWLVKAVKKHIFPNLGRIGSYLVAFAGVLLFFDIPMELVATRVVHFDAFLGPIIPQLCLWPGTYYQFPLYEFMCFGGVLAGCSMLILSAWENNGISFVEQGLESHTSGLKKELVRSLSVIAWANLMNSVYIWFCILLSVTLPRVWPADIPSWLLYTLPK